jgi:HlyD family secretion protein
VTNDTIKRILEKNQWDLNKEVLDVELSNLAVNYATLISPIGGIVTHIDTPVAGVNITPATAVFQVMDPTSIVFRANVDETDVGLVDVGQKAEVILDAYPNQTFTGKVVSVSYAAQTTGGGGTVFPLDIAIDTLKSQRIGFNGDVDITVNELPGQLVIPIDAVREEDAGSFVYKKEGSTYKKITVKIVQTGLDDVVVSGLTVGDEIVVKGFDALPDK